MNKLTMPWVKKAEADFAVALTESRREDRSNDVICFLCQQTAEKYLKAFLQEWSLPIPYTHDLAQLHALVQPHLQRLRSLRRSLKRMSRFAVDYRYPGRHATRPQVVAAMRLARRVRYEIRRYLGLRTVLPRK